MKYGNVTMGQMEAAINKLGGMEGFNALLADELVVSRKEPPQILSFKQDIGVAAPAKALDLKSFFKNRSGLYVWDEFLNRANALLVKVRPTEDARLKSYDLVQKAYDSEIKAKLSEHHEIELWQIAELIERQKDGEDGPLLNNGYWNIFYVADYVVSVYWDAGAREWVVHAWKLDVSQWLAGARVFSGN